MPGFWPSKDFVAMVFAWKDMMDVKVQGTKETSGGRFSFTPAGRNASPPVRHLGERVRTPLSPASITDKGPVSSRSN